MWHHKDTNHKPFQFNTYFKTDRDCEAFSLIHHFPHRNQITKHASND